MYGAVAEIFPKIIVSKFKESKLISILKNLQVENKARFIRRTLHEPNLIIWFGACKDRRMNQLGSTDLYLGRPAERQKFDFDSDVELFTCAEPNAHTVTVCTVCAFHRLGMSPEQRTSF